jgi:predicted Zn-dependent peptidase
MRRFYLKKIIKDANLNHLIFSESIMDELFKPYKTVLPSGLTVMTLRTERKGLIGGEIAFGVGAAHAAKINPEWLGLPHYIEHMLQYGASRNYETHEVNRLFSQKFGLVHNAWTSGNETRYFTNGGAGHALPTRHFWGALTAAADGLFFPRFDSFSMERERSRIVEERSSGLTQLRLDDAYFYKMLYGQDHLEWQTLGSLEQIMSYGYNDFVACHQRCYSLQNTAVAIVGDITHQEAIDKVSAIFQGASEQNSDLPTLGKLEVQNGEYRRHIDGANEGHLESCFYFKAASFDDPDFYATQIAVAGLGEIIVDRLMNKYGLYSAAVSHRNWATHAAGSITLFLQTAKREKIADATAEALELLQSPATHKTIADSHQSLMDKKTMAIEVNQAGVGNIASDMNIFHNSNMPLRMFGAEVKAFNETSPDQVEAVLKNLGSVPMFMNLRGHPGMLDALPPIDVVDGWRVQPSTPAPMTNAGPFRKLES